MGNLEVGVLDAILVICAILAYRYPRQGLLALLIYLPFWGTLAYTVFLGSSVYVFLLGKDLFYVPALIAVVQDYWRERRSLPAPRFVLLALAILIVLALSTLVFVNGRRQLFANGDEQPLLIGIWGLKVLIGYIPLVLVFFLRLARHLAILGWVGGFWDSSHV